MKLYHFLPAGVTAAILGTVFVMPLGLLAQEDKPLTSQPNERIFVHKMRRLTAMEGGTSVDWSSANGHLLISKRSVNQYFNVHSVTPDGIRQRCLTLPRRWSTAVQHKGDASWHPEGKYFVFVAQNRGSNSYTASLPGTGLNCNLWVGTRGGEDPWMITDVASTNPPRRGVVSPQFSPDGKKLFWAGNLGVDSSGATLNQRAMFLGDFRIDNDGKPVLENIQTLQPGEMRDCYDSSGFTPDGNKLVFSGNLGKDQSVFGMDIYTMDLRTEKIEPLTNSPNVWDQYPAYSPDGKKIVFMSSHGLNLRFYAGGLAKWMNYLVSELWIMNSDGTEPKQLTRFNTFGTPEHLRRRCFVGDSAWSPDGKQVTICLIKETGGKELNSDVIIMDLDIDPPAKGVQVDWASPTAEAVP
ncbi:MAG: hypothetical protein A3K18_30540 [Lentisphaerae bacterium RIFOXYA12_64_32]|nr:MAG: hypothetical protein A3K18_30540 [Lentisphaerae bacterium RIFOXYA12_64_32]